MSRTGTRRLGLICVAFALACLFVWIPLDTNSGLIETVRRRTTIGDALAPTVAAVLVLLGGIILLLAPGRDAAAIAPIRPLLRFGAMMTVVLVASFLVMLYAGPLAVAVANIWQDTPLEYRLLRGTGPWKYLGFSVGGVTAITTLIAMAERRLTWHAFGIAFASVLAMIVLFDLPFDDLLLPPNGDY